MSCLGAASKDTFSSAIGALVVCITLAAALPLIVGQPAALQDWPSHVARVQIIDEMLRGNSFWLDRYHFHAWVLTNFVLDFGMEGIHLLGLSIANSATVFLLATYFCFVTGFSYLSRCLPEAPSDPSKPLLAILIFFTGPLLLGLVSFVLGLAIAFWVWAWWLRARENTRARSVIGVAGVFAICCCHIAAACAFAFVLFCFRLTEAKRGYLLRTTLTPATLLPAIVLVGLIVEILVTSRESDAGEHHAIMSLGPSSRYGDILQHVMVIPHMLFDGIGLYGLAITVVAGVILFIVTIRGSTLRVSRVVVIAVCATLLIALLLPINLGLSGRVSYRAALVPLAIFAAGVQFVWHSTLGRKTAMVTLMLLTLARSGALTIVALKSNDEYQNFATIAEQIPSGSILVTALGRSFEKIPWSEFWSPPLEELASAEVQRSVFVTSIFASGSQQPIALDVRYDAVRRPYPIDDPDGFAHIKSVLQTLCKPASEVLARPRVYLLVVYTDAVFDGRLKSRDVLGKGRAYRLIDACSFAAS